MKCPVCKDVDLVMSERQSIEIDYCPNCRGVWLDRGELDKLIEKSATQHKPQTHTPQPHYPQPHYPQPQTTQNYPHKKRESWLSDLFD